MGKFNYLPEKPLLIAGFGNILISDEGAGVLVIQELKKLDMPNNITLLDGGTMGIDFISFLNKYSQVIIIDCLKTFPNEGNVIQFTLDQVKVNDNNNISIHGIDLNTVINLMCSLNMKIPEILIYGIKPYNLNYGIGVSDNVLKSINQITRQIDSFIKINC